MLQTAIVTLLVIGSAAYAAWALMPGAWRRAVARRVGRPMPARSSCGGCDSCASTPGERPLAVTAEQPIRIVRR